MTPGHARPRTLIVVVVGMLLALAAMCASGHDVPGEMRVHAFVKQEGDKLNVLVRIPLALLLNLDLPKRGPGYIDLAHIDEHLPRAIAATDKDLAFFADGHRLVITRALARISQPSERSFESYEKAHALLEGPRLAETVNVFWNQGYFDVLLEYQVASQQPGLSVDFHISPGLRDRLRLDLRYITGEGTVRAYDIPTGSGELALDPRWYQAFWSFTQAGFAHILDGPDHLLFLLCLVLPFRRLDWYLVAVITSFTVAHSITLIAAAYGVVPSGAWFPPLVETLIAISILYTAIENILRPNLERRWFISGLFGLVHGFGFSFLLKSQLQFAGSHLLLSLVAFNVGIELGQLLVLALGFPLLAFLYRRLPGREQVLIIILSVLVGHAAWHWLTQRAEVLSKADWSGMPSAASILGILFVVAAALAATWWLVKRVVHRSIPSHRA